MMMQFKIGEQIVGDGAPCFIIAEAGVNHNGKIALAKQLVDIAADAGTDAVKFQTYKTTELILPDIEKAPYQMRTTDQTEGQMQMLKSLEIDEAFHLRIIERCKERDILFLSTPYDLNSLDLLLKLNVPAIKIASTDTTNLLFLEKVAQTGKPVILSTGMSTLNEIESAVHCLRENGCSNLALLKCTSDYPTKPEEVNLAAMSQMAYHFNAVIGFSDHTQGVGASPYAVAMGSHIVEKHFTVDKSLPGPDHQASLSPKELTEWVKAIREVEVYLGRPEIEPTPGELINRKTMRKNIVAKVDIPAKTIINRSHVTAKRTGGQGIPAIEVFNVLDRITSKSISAGSPLFWHQVEEIK
jgi:N,N'-diacetyllegionaminate synthase